MGEFAFPFGVGLLAAFNPCGFAMLPAYLSYFLGLDGGDDNGARTRLATVTRGLLIGLTMTLGFVAVFGTFGFLFATVVDQSTVLDVLPFVVITIGVLMIPLGLAMIAGREVSLRLPKMNKGTGSRDLSSVFVFGVSYAVVSLSCTIPLFIIAVSNSFTSDGVARGTGNFLAYAIGMGLVIVFLTMSLAMAKSNVAVSMRRVLPWVRPVSGVALVVAGIYLIDYGIWDYKIVIDGRLSADNLFVDQFTEFQTAVNNWIEQTTTERIGLVALLGILGLLLLAWRDDTADPARRRGVTVGYLATLVAVEAYNRGEFVALPLLRFVGGWPLRIAHWFTDPVRGGVPLEAAFTALIGWLVWRRTVRWRAARYGADHVAGALGAS